MQGKATCDCLHRRQSDFFDGRSDELLEKIKSFKPWYQKNNQATTNYERIKNMNVDEMSEFLMDWAMRLYTGKAPMNVKKWLESEVEEK